MGWIKISVDETCHVAWKVRAGDEEWCLHAIGQGESGNQVTTELAQVRFDGGKCKTPWLPVLFPHRAVTPGRRSINCVTASARALLRGWFWWF
ncbi:MAG TPA: hypothetical protein VEA69_26105 [Tepidisphaeraceae bacterium]|nr:hypothetical protein [Tepidisphaeraceae bacterium]